MCTEELLKVDGGKAVPLCFQEAHLSSASPHLRHSPSFSLSVHTVGQEGSKMFKDVQSIVIYHDIMHFCSRCAKRSYCTVTQQKTIENLSCCKFPSSEWRPHHESNGYECYEWL